MNEPATASEEWRRYWPTVLAAMVGMSFYTVITYSLSTFIGPLEKEFGWSRTALSSGLTIFAAISMLGGPFVGMALDKFGTRRLAIVGMVLTGGAFTAFSTLSGSMTQWIALYVIYGVFALAIKSTVWSAGISSVFTHARSLALAVVLSGSAIGQTLAPLAANKLINAFGWREAYIWLGLGWAGLALILLVPFYFDAHARKARAADKGGATTTVVLPGLTIPQAIRDIRVIRIAVANLLMSMVGSGVSVHLVRIVSESGIAMDTAVEIAATAGLAGLVGKLGVGWLLDRIQGSIIPFFGFATGAFGHFLLIGLIAGPSPLLIGAMCIGFASGAGLQISTYLVSRYAGLRNFGAIFGTISSMMMAGTAVGPLIAGAVHDLTGSYDMLEMIAAPTMLLCAFLFVGLGPYPEFRAAEEK
ncbi:MFS transporter [Novosphingobium mangrovi (ex Huang et al. 2023)]|uniref:MFS transporter n=1 Tax=Novosphingobium mangrovi (ex Huang et al. 2023) TaxID=2976432 RepID=A0ABT2I895_9SPHN|nr:MFS transporter [Novosphingobium mangrovi (ex Huang et al. 2023)]MCT2401043.1 MFS transporter [Novosphingobium mangrovi (ex Huang et al. 2023)]